MYKILSNENILKEEKVFYQIIVDIQTKIYNYVYVYGGWYLTLI